ncbi:MAG: hypothetical protein H8E43_10765 [Planctomycetia bacterium]|nr:hypothetical protein [Planctomycetia bacterium]
MYPEQKIFAKFENSESQGNATSWIRSRDTLPCTRLLGLLLFILLPSIAWGQFNPTSSTTFDNLEAGLPSGFSQQAFFAEGDEGPASLVVTFDRGSFSFNGYSPGQLVGGLVVDLFVPTPILTVQGLIIAEVQVISVGPNSLTANAVVTEVTGNVIPGLAFLGIPDPTGATAFNVLYTDLPGDSGAVMNVSDAGSLPLSGALGFNVPLTWNTPAILNHSPFGGELNVETILTASSGATAIFPENFSLSGGIAPPQPVTALNCNTAAESVQLSWQNSGTYDSIDIFRNGSLRATIVGDATGFLDNSPEPGLNQYEVKGVLLGLPSTGSTCSTEVSVPLNLVELPTLDAAPATPLNLDITASLELPTEGFSLPISYDPFLFRFDGATIDQSDSAGAEFFMVESDGIAGVTSIFLLYDSADVEHIPSGISRVLCQIQGMVRESVTEGTPVNISLPVVAGDPPVAAIIVQNNGAGYSPQRTDGVINVVGPPITAFSRGDANLDLSLDLADAIAVLGFLFSTTGTSGCMSALDANDDEVVDVADPIQILDTLFGGGAPLPEPSLGNCSPDPTVGTLTCIQGACP